MKNLSQNIQQPKWNDQLLNDLAFIKRHLRYPIVRARLQSAVLWSVIFMTPLVLFTLLDTSNTAHPRFFTIIQPLMCIFLCIMFMYRTRESLRFSSIPTDFSSVENRQLTEDFLRSLHLAFYQHPNAPEVLQILSRNTSAGKEDREVMIFIADDNRILINSHFTGKWYSFPPSKGHYREIADKLQLYIKRLSIINNDTVIVANNPF